MELSGEVLCKASAEDVRERFFNPDLLKACFPNCQSMEQIAPGHYHAKILRWAGGEEVIRQEIRLIPGQSDLDFIMTSKALDEQATILSSHNSIQLEEREGGTLLTYHVSLKLGTLTDDPAFDPKKTLTLTTSFFEAIADKVKKETLPMPDKPTEKEAQLDQAMHKAEDAVLELEHEAEEAAAKGFLGGAQGWGLIALGILVLGLLIFYR